MKTVHFSKIKSGRVVLSLNGFCYDVPVHPNGLINIPGGKAEIREIDIDIPDVEQLEEKYQRVMEKYTQSLEKIAEQNIRMLQLTSQDREQEQCREADKLATLVAAAKEAIGCMSIGDVQAARRKLYDALEGMGE